MSIIHKTLLTLGACALLVLPACDKGGDDKKTDDKADKAEKTDDKADKAEKTDDEADKADDKADKADDADADAEPAATAEVDAGGRVEVLVDASGYHPAQITAPANSKVTLAFKRTTEQGCGQELVIATMDVKKELPLNEAVEIEVEVPESGELGFACGMNMYKGKVVPKA